MDKKDEALKLAREMLIDNREYVQLHERPSYLALYDKAIARVEAAMEEQPAQQSSKPLTDEQVAVLNFMLGADELDGVWFGERYPQEKGAFWWRNRLRNAFQDAAIEAKLREKNA